MKEIFLSKFSTNSLDSRQALNEKLIDDHTLAALTIMIAESRPEEKGMMISVITPENSCPKIVILANSLYMP